MKNIITPWATTGTRNAIPESTPTDTGAASWTSGFTPLNATPIAAGGVPVSEGDMNGCLFEVTDILAQNARGIYYAYNSAFAAAIGGYPLGARLVKASGRGTWYNNVANNTSNPDTGGAGWLAGEKGLLLAVKTYTSGTTAYTPTPGTSTLIVEMVGGGGSTTATGVVPAGTIDICSGGNSGAYVKCQIDAPASGSVVVGAGAAPSAIGTGTGNTGGTSSFAGIVCPGGSGGRYNSGLSTSIPFLTPPNSTNNPAPTTPAGAVVLGIANGFNDIRVMALSLVVAANSEYFQPGKMPTYSGAGSRGWSAIAGSSNAGNSGIAGAVIISEYS